MKQIIVFNLYTKQPPRPSLVTPITINIIIYQQILTNTNKSHDCEYLVEHVMVALMFYSTVPNTLHR